jgi:hypothetical protein
VKAFTEERTVSKGLWPPRSQDLPTCDFYLWGYFRGKFYESNPYTLDKLRKNIRRATETIEVTVLRKAYLNMITRKAYLNMITRKAYLNIITRKAYLNMITRKAYLNMITRAQYVLIHKDLISNIFCKSVHSDYQKLNETKSFISPSKRVGFKWNIL